MSGVESLITQVQPTAPAPTAATAPHGVNVGAASGGRTPSGSSVAASSKYGKYHRRLRKVQASVASLSDPAANQTTVSMGISPLSHVAEQPVHNEPDGATDTQSIDPNGSSTNVDLGGDEPSPTPLRRQTATATGSRPILRSSEIDAVTAPPSTALTISDAPVNVKLQQQQQQSATTSAGNSTGGGVWSQFIRTILCCFTTATTTKSSSSAASADCGKAAAKYSLSPAATAQPQPPLKSCTPSATTTSRLPGAAGSGIVTLPKNWLLKPLLPIDANKKCLILDLDETLVHSSFKPVPQADFIIPVEIDNHVHMVYVLKRPFVDEFLQRMGMFFEVVIFTASLAKYADPVIDSLDRHNVVRHRLFRESCFNHRGSYVKDLSQLGRDLSSVIIIDNSPASYLFHPSNAVPITSWFNDINDVELMDLMPFLEDLSHLPNVTAVLDTTNTEIDDD